MPPSSSKEDTKRARQEEEHDAPHGDVPRSARPTLSQMRQADAKWLATVFNTPADSLSTLKDEDIVGASQPSLH
jgi:hypothetical protein